MALSVIASSCWSGNEASRETLSPIAEETRLPPDPSTTPTSADEVVATTPGDPSGGETEDAGEPSESLDIAEPERDCSPQIPDDLPISDISPALVGIEISQAIYSCAHEVGLAFANDLAAISTLQSRGIQGPLLLVGPWFDIALMAELGRLAPERIVAAGFDEQVLQYALVDFAFDLVAVDPQATFSPEGVSYDRVWLFDNAEQAAPLAALGHQIGIGVIALTGDLRAASPEILEMISGASQVEMLSDFGEDAVWQLDVVRRGDEIPGGGLLMFESGHGRRLVAMYGHPTTSGLGVLGEQGPDEGVERLRSIAEGYDADGSVVLPTFEIIATIASAGPGRDGDYSGETARDEIRPWVEIAAANGIYVVLDLQPGRTDFLTQAKYYEEFLRLPHVGLALDPEWRLKPDQVHLLQIGTVDAAEINQVVDWLAGIVREEALPQKLLILHQFRLPMITNRHLVETPPELAVLIQMDGQGPLGSKYNTWNTLTNKPDAERFHWGWKNFYDEDSPTATPDQVLELTPTPGFVSFQ